MRTLIRTLVTLLTVALLASASVLPAIGLSLGPIRLSGIEDDDLAIDVAVTPDAVYVLENLYPSGGSNGSLELLAYAVDGTPLWSLPLPDSATFDWTNGAGAIEANDSGVYVADLEGHDTVVHRFDPDGIEQWARTVGAAPGITFPGDIAVGEGLVVVAGATSGSLVAGHTGESSDAYAAAFGTDGSARWIRQWGGSNTDVAATVDLHDGVVAVANRSAPSGTDGWETRVSTFDLAGARRWHRTITEPEGGAGNGIATADGRVWVGGIQPDASGVSQGFATAFASDGRRTWTTGLAAGTRISDLARLGRSLVAVGDLSVCEAGRCRVSGLVTRIGIDDGEATTDTFGGRKRVMVFGVDGAGSVRAICGSIVDGYVVDGFVRFRSVV